jgi:DNA-binding CsgD family transcriptional regulator
MPYLSENALKLINTQIDELIIILETLKEGLKEPSNNLEVLKKKNEELLKMKILTEDNWTIFLHLFKHTHKDYYHHILNTYSETLSAAEFRLLLLLKLSRSNSLIASILGISKDSVRICIYRTRCKLSLRSKKELFEVLDKIP